MDGGRRDISGGGRRDISGGGRRDMDGGGRRDISGGGRRDISGMDGGRRDISGGGRRDISGGGRRDISGGVQYLLYMCANVPVCSVPMCLCVFSANVPMCVRRQYAYVCSVPMCLCVFSVNVPMCVQCQCIIMYLCVFSANAYAVPMCVCVFSAYTVCQHPMYIGLKWIETAWNGKQPRGPDPVREVRIQHLNKDITRNMFKHKCGGASTEARREQKREGEEVKEELITLQYLNSTHHRSVEFHIPFYII